MSSKIIIRPIIITISILAIPALMMLFSAEGWLWTLGDFIAMGALLFGAGLSYEILSSKTNKPALRIAIAIAIISAVFLIWAELAVDGVSRIIRFLLR